MSQISFLIDDTWTSELNATEEPQKISHWLIVGVPCSAAFLLIVLSITIVYFLKLRKRNSRKFVSVKMKGSSTTEFFTHIDDCEIDEVFSAMKQQANESFVAITKGKSYSGRECTEFETAKMGNHCNCLKNQNLGDNGNPDFFTKDVIDLSEKESTLSIPFPISNICEQTETMSLVSKTSEFESCAPIINTNGNVVLLSDGFDKAAALSFAPVDFRDGSQAEETIDCDSDDGCVLASLAPIASTPVTGTLEKYVSWEDEVNDEYKITDVIIEIPSSASSVSLPHQASLSDHERFTTFLKKAVNSDVIDLYSNDTFCSIDSDVPHSVESLDSHYQVLLPSPTKELKESQVFREDDGFYTYQNLLNNNLCIGCVLDHSISSPGELNTECTSQGDNKLNHLCHDGSTSSFDEPPIYETPLSLTSLFPLSNSFNMQCASKRQNTFGVFKGTTRVETCSEYNVPDHNFLSTLEKDAFVKKIENAVANQQLTRSPIFSSPNRLPPLCKEEVCTTQIDHKCSFSFSSEGFCKDALNQTDDLKNRINLIENAVYDIPSNVPKSNILIPKNRNDCNKAMFKVNTGNEYSNMAIYNVPSPSDSKTVLEEFKKEEINRGKTKPPLHFSCSTSVNNYKNLFLNENYGNHEQKNNALTQGNEVSEYSNIIIYQIPSCQPTLDQI